MTKRFAMQCCITGNEADMLIELFGLLEVNLPHCECEVIDGFPTGNVRIGMTAQDQGRISEITGHFAEKLENLPVEETGDKNAGAFVRYK